MKDVLSFALVGIYFGCSLAVSLNIIEHIEDSPKTIKAMLHGLFDERNLFGKICIVILGVLIFPVFTFVCICRVIWVLLHVLVKKLDQIGFKKKQDDIHKSGDIDH